MADVKPMILDSVLYTCKGNADSRRVGRLVLVCAEQASYRIL